MNKKNHELIRSEKAPEPVGLYPHARRVDNLLFLSGVGPRVRGSKDIPGVKLDKNGNIIEHDIARQCHAVFKNVRQILEDAGSGWDKLIDVTVFLTNMKDDFETYNKIYGEYFKDNQPCRTTVEVKSLPTPIAIELKCIAHSAERKDAQFGRLYAMRYAHLNCYSLKPGNCQPLLNAIQQLSYSF